jgi:hypothetical protein
VIEIYDVARNFKKMRTLRGAADGPRLFLCLFLFLFLFLFPRLFLPCAPPDGVAS